LGTFEKLEENFCYRIVGSAAFTAWKLRMIGVPEGKERTFGGGNILSFCAFMVPHRSGIVFHHLQQAFDKNLRGLSARNGLFCRFIQILWFQVGHFCIHVLL